MKHRKIVLLLTFLVMSTALILCGCSESAPLSFPPFSELQKFTVQEYENSSPVSREIPLSDYHVTIREGLLKHYKEYKNEIDPALKEKAFVYRLTLADGSVRKILIFSDEKYNYIEETGVSTWREKNPKNIASAYSYEKKFYLNYWTYQNAFADGLESGSFSLLPEYNGAEKAIWVDLTMQEEKNHDAFWWTTRFIPDEYAASRAEDVRFIFVVGYASKVYKGYWYVPSTGQRLGNAYDETFTYNAYDLVTGESSILAKDVGWGFSDTQAMVAEYLAGRAAP